MGGDFASDKKTKKSGFFSRVFGGKKKDDEGAQNVGSNSANAELVDQGNSSGKSNGFQKFSVSEANELFELGDKLGSSFKLGFKDNSSQFNDVMISLDMLNASMSAAFDDNVRNNQRKYQVILMQIDDVIDNCANYLSTHAEPKTPFGKRRKELVTQIRTVAQVDRSRLESKKSEFDSMSGEEQAQMTVAELFRSARTVKLHTDDFEKFFGSKAAGGRGADVLKMNVNGSEADTVGEGQRPTHFFKFEDEFDISKGNWRGEGENREVKFLGATMVDNLLERFPKVTEGDKNVIREWVKDKVSNSREDLIPLDSLSEAGKEAARAVNGLLSGGDTSFSLIQDLQLPKKMTKANLSRRNVATSRVAELLGVGNLVAKSESVEITDDNNNVYRGNLMESAKGETDALSLAEKTYKGRKPSELMSGEGFQQEIGVTGAFQRDLCNLQILDCVCGQLDRHAGNFLVSRNEEGDLSGLQGIDNDGSFGLNEDSGHVGGRHNRSVVNRESEEIEMPFIDEKIAERIETLEPSAFKYILKDLISDDEINACIVRFNKIKEAIKKTRNTHPEKFLENEDDWNDDTAQRMLDHSQEKRNLFSEMGMSKGKKYVSDIKIRNDRSVNYQTYFGRLMGETMTPGNAYAGQKTATKIKRHK